MSTTQLRGLAIPEDPTPELNESERYVWRKLREQLRDGDVLLTSRRFTDSENGDVEIDLLVLLPDVGAAVIEVKGGVVSYENGEYFTRSGARYERRIHPIRQARGGKHALRAYLNRQPTWSMGLLRTEWLCVFPYTKLDGDLGPEGRREQLIGEGELDDALGRVYDVLQSCPDPNPVPAHPAWVDRVIDLLEGRPDPEADVARFSAMREDAVDRLTRDQARVCDMFSENQSLEIVGPAGSGKSWIAMELAHRWAKEGKRVAYLTYGGGMAESVRRSGLACVTYIGTFHGLGREWEVEQPAGADQDLWVREMPERMSAAALLLPEHERFDAYVVDEAQDFADAWWDVLFLAARDRDELRLAVFRDDAQEVFPGRRGHPEMPLAKVRLRENLRNAREIVETFAPLVPDEIKVLGGHGLPVEFIECEAGDVFGVADDVALDLIETRGYTRDHIAVLTTKHRHPMQAEARHVHGEKHWDLLWEGDDIFYSTVAGFKGLERPVIVLAVDGFHDDLEPRNVMYTGMSRARDLLIVVGDRDSIKGAVGDKIMRRLQRGQKLD